MFELTSQVPANAEVGVIIFVRVPKSRSSLKFVDVRLNICDVLRHIKSVPIIVKIVNKILEGTNLPLSCPIEGNIMYNLTDIVITDEIFPVYTPSLNFNFTGNYYADDNLVGTFFVKGSTLKK
ncbi:uncharacterized protein LOC142236007 [Haematobia irritans]|uniref:uncharacterized protein LOC142236007 n=1 Tax=Haematobia irritans TaxID=7368 RepID=UPI003F50CFAC